MKKETQNKTNPYKYSDTNKRYQTFDYWLRHRFGEKCAKISLDAGFSCPNIDGKISHGGCIFCSGGSSGAMCEGSLKEQYEAGVLAVQKKWNCRKFIPYLQAHTNTYASPEKLREIYREVSSFDGAVMLAIATRADCLSDEVLGVLRETSEKIPLIVELGLQSSSDETAKLINRGHTFSDFKDGYGRLRSIGGNISVCVHIINGLPGEDEAAMLRTATDVAALHPDMVKIHLLHILKNTRLAELYSLNKYTPMKLDEYVNTVVSQIELLPEDTVIARVTGDGKAENLLAPAWSMKKTVVSNEIDKELFARSSIQGICCESR